jgi:hypothetical protein
MPEQMALEKMRWARPLAAYSFFPALLAPIPQESDLKEGNS